MTTTMTITTTTITIISSLSLPSFHVDPCMGPYE
jgi:hypothetical protein